MTYDDLHNFDRVPAEAREVVSKKCQKWDVKYGYKDKNYTDNPTYQLQLLANASFSEEQTLRLISSAAVKREINDLLAKNGLSFHLADNYFLNDQYPGVIMNDFFRLTDKTWCDLVRIGGSYDADAIWSIEVKATKTYSAHKISALHGADIAFVYYLDSGEIHLLATPVFPRRDRTIADYVDLGALAEKIDFKPIKINKNWEISY